MHLHLIRKGAHRLGLFALALTFVLLGSNRAHAQLFPANDVYREVSELIQDLIRNKVGDSVAATLRTGRITNRYFRATTARLESRYWGALDVSLEADLIELAVDFAYYTAEHPKQSKKAFWVCVLSRSETFDDGCGFEAKKSESEAAKTLFDSHCTFDKTSIACDVARTVKASLEQRDEIARSEAVQLFGDLVIAGNMPEPKTPEESELFQRDLLRFRERVRAWLAGPDALRKQIDQFLKDFDIPESDLLRRGIDCTQPLKPDAIFNRALVLTCFGDDDWRARWDASIAAKIVVRGTTQTTTEWSVARLRDRGDGTLDGLVTLAAAATCNSAPQDAEINGDLIKRKLDEAVQTLSVARPVNVANGLKRDDTAGAIARNLTEQSGLKAGDARLSELKEVHTRLTAQLAEDTKQADASAKAEAEAVKRVAEAEAASATFHKSLKAFFTERGVDCGDKPTLRVPVEIQIGGLDVIVPVAESGLRAEFAKQVARGLMSAHSSQENVKAFRDRVSSVICGGCTLRDPVASARRIIGAADLLNSMPLESRERLLADVSSAMQLAVVVGASPDNAQIVEKLAPILRASKRGDYRQLASSVLDSLWPSPKGEAAGSKEAMYLAFFKSFAAFLMDARKGTASGESTAVAFREAAKGVLVSDNKRGIPNIGNVAYYWVSAALRLSWNQTYQDGQRTLVSLDALSARWAASKYVGIGGSVFDLLAPFAEVALRDQHLDYDDSSQALIPFNAFQPRFLVWVAAPEFSRFLTVDAAVSYRPVAPSKADDTCVSGCKFEYTFGHKPLDHVEMSVGLSVLF
ncbi:MAG TPA: hypothetical protein VJV79_14875 [Polyangiaceae bacterium]|nr:hypothetical protein [Polyangiaceae bacterium]